MLCVFDSETTDTPKKLPFNHPEQPYLVELAALLFEDDGKERASFNFVIKPDGWESSEIALSKHGISNEIAERSGIPLKLAVVAFCHFIEQCDLLVAHNSEFDTKIINIAMHRSDYIRRLPTTKCTMRLATPVLKLPPTLKMLERGMVNHYKRPSLAEAHQALLGCGFEGAHRAIDDARAAARVFFALREKGVC